MTAAIDRALGDTTPASTHPPAVWCWRCQHRKAVQPGHMCDPCGAYMRGDTDTDPKARPTTPARPAWRWPR